MTADGYDLAVVGAGIVGLGHAAAARERGLRVVVVDRSTEIIGASVRNFGHACLTPQLGQAREYAERTRELWLRYGAQAGFWVSESGTVVAARAADELAVLDEWSRGEPGVTLLDAQELSEWAPVVGAVGGARLPRDLQVDPRQAAPALARHLERGGVEFRWRTSALGAEPGLLHTSRGPIRAEAIAVCVGHDVDHLYPALAEERGVVRCGLDMIRVEAGALPAQVRVPVFTGWSLMRYSGFAVTAAAASVRDRLAAQHPDLYALDLNQMYTPQRDGSLLAGDTHYRGLAITPFQAESSFAALETVTRDLFGVARLPVSERWQGIYASAPDEFLIAAPVDGVRVVSVTTGIGMTTGLGLGDAVVAELFGTRAKEVRT
ncbi:oxidoreductase [Catellatospora sp. TT07R-123]|uniref:TIGR03364 family FAD-dependent oxidoreductase n=1 Tax=Catellatospora sp. TT07R-123 TaxID=2733863 RepID=UPI001B240108|nr:TIGR03364 family FAD-dependent oxidoreductase [Catellatospora sp. TT07R-123]GHJ47230.1 oxidoreductase [Catellatospora sp. TT07R-123]